MIVDTGSSNLALAVSSCDCEYGDTDFTCKTISSETIDVQYGSGSWSGVATEPIRVGFKGTDVYSASVTMAAITEQDEFFTADGFYGIMGLGYAAMCESYSGTDAEPILDQLEDAGALSDKSFSLVFCEDAPKMALGGIDDSMLNASVTYVDTQKFVYEPIYDEYMYYLVDLKSLSVDGTKLDLSGTDLTGDYGGAAVDSGTTLLYLPTTAVEALEVAVYDILSDKAGWSMEEASSFFSMESYLTEKSDLDDFPTLVLDMGGYERTLEPSHYVFEYEGFYVWGVGESSFPIVGDVALNEMVVVFDQAENKVGFGVATCYSDDDDASASSSSTHSSHSSHHKSDRDSPAGPMGEGPSKTLAAKRGVAEKGDSASSWVFGDNAAPAAGDDDLRSGSAAEELAAQAATTTASPLSGAATAIAAVGAAVGVVAAAVGIALRRRRAAAAVYVPI